MVLVSSHVLAEMSQTGDDVIVIGRGRLIAHAPLEELTGSSTGAVRVRTPNADRLESLLRAAGKTLGLSALIAILTLVFADQTPGFTLSEEDPQRSLFTSAGFNSIFALVFGIIGMAGEYKQGTITPTFLAAPQRWRVVVGKALAYAIGGFLLGLSSSLLVARISYVGLAIRDIDVVLSAREVFELFGGSTATATFYGVLGVAVGAVIPNQIAALIGALVEQLIAEPLLFNFFPEEARFLIGGAGSILSGTPNLAPRCRYGRPRACWRLRARRCWRRAASLPNARTSPDGVSGGA